jgi:hypothetical protein
MKNVTPNFQHVDSKDFFGADVGPLHQDRHECPDREFPLILGVLRWLNVALLNLLLVHATLGV